MRYKPGDIVIKTSGGNKMTVQSKENNLYKCFWFVDSKLYEEEFDENDITTINDYIKVEEREDKINNILR